MSSKWYFSFYIACFHCQLVYKIYNSMNTLIACNELNLRFKSFWTAQTHLSIKHYLHSINCGLLNQYICFCSYCGVYEKIGGYALVFDWPSSVSDLFREKTLFPFPSSQLHFLRRNIFVPWKTQLHRTQEKKSEIQSKCYSLCIIQL